MKKTIVCSMFVVLLLPLAARAQDTVTLQDGWYLPPYHTTFEAIADTSCDLFPFAIFTEGLEAYPNYTFTWISAYDAVGHSEDNIYGIALTADNFPHYYEGYDMEPTFALYHGTDYNSHAMGCFSFTGNHDSVTAYGHLTKDCYFVYEIDNGKKPGNRVVPAIEVYFDTPIPVSSLASDTIGAGFNWNASRIQRYLTWLHSTYSAADIDKHKFLLYGAFHHHSDSITCPLYGGCSQHSESTDLMNCLFHFYDTYSGVTFPIVQLRCAAPNPMLLGRETQEATVGWWQAEEGEATQLSLGPYGSDPDSGLLVTPADTFHTFTGLQPDCVYSAWVRKACRYTTAGYDTLVWSDWSRPLVFRTKVGIGKVDADTDVRLQPNPARDKVTVSSSFGLLHIEIHDAAGVLVYSEAASERQKTIGIGSLRSGTYIVTVQTHAGTTHKKLAVQR